MAQSFFDSLIGDRLKTAKNAPERIKVLEQALEKGRLSPKDMQAIHEELKRLRESQGRK